MSERPPQTPNVDQVRQQIQTKAWYGLDPRTGAFSWPKSLEKLAQAFPPLNVEQLNQIISDCFTPSCLSQVKLNINNEIRSVPLLRLINDLKIPVFIWTVGDADWQQVKFERSGASNYIPVSHYFCSDQNKVQTLETIVSAIFEETVSSAPVAYYIIVVDDKQDNLHQVMELSKLFKSRNIQLGNYHMKLDDPQADATAFYHWLIKQKNLSQERGEELVLVLDFDGVVADTNSVLFGPVAEKIAQLLQQSALPKI